jgi:rod shape-determining protein MreC
MIRLSIQARQALAKLTLPVLIAASFGLMLLGKADTLLAEHARMALADALAPLYAALAPPLEAVRDRLLRATELWQIGAENARLRAENEQLRRWQSIALALDAENQRLKAELNWVPDNPPSFVAARVVADAGGIYARAVLLSVGPNHAVRRGEIALDERGLVGRVTEVGTRTARVLLLTDLNSRIPVMLVNSHAHAILTGTNGPRPRLIYWAEGNAPQEAERVVTSSEAGAFPANLPVGTVHLTVSNVPEVIPAAMLDRLEIVRVFDYGLGELVAPDAAGQLPERHGR